MLDTAASPTPAAMPGTWPAARKTIGTTPDIPAPRHAKPTIAATGAAATSARPKPTAATLPPARTTASGPKRSTRRSPKTRPSVIVTLKAVKPMAAIAAVVPSSSRR